MTDNETAEGTSNATQAASMQQVTVVNRQLNMKPFAIGRDSEPTQQADGTNREKTSNGNSDSSVSAIQSWRNGLIIYGGRIDIADLEESEESLPDTAS